MAEMSSEEKRKMLHLIDTTNIISRWDTETDKAKKNGLPELKRSDLNSKFRSIFTDLVSEMTKALDVLNRD